MFSSLRSRLWLSYAVITAIALCVVAVVMFGFIAQNPLSYRQATARLLVVQSALLKNASTWQELPADDMQKVLERIATNFDVRIVVFDVLRKPIADSNPQADSAIAMPRMPRLRPSAVFYDDARNPWLYILRRLDNGRWLMVMTPRPNVPFISIIRDELFLPVLLAGTVALFISLLLAYLISRWVADPLQQMVMVANNFPKSASEVIPLKGPYEVKEVIQAFDSMRSRMLKSQHSQSVFIANVSHELKTPLTSIQGFSQALLDGTASKAEDQKQAAQVIYDQSTYMSRMVLDLLDLARIDAGNFDLKWDIVDMSQLLQSVVARFKPQASSAGISIEFSAHELPPIFGDGDRLSQVFNNLMDNAIKFSPGGGVVQISGIVESGFLLIEIRDSGAGIAPDDLAHIFDRFYQADTARKGGRGHGAGLGLAIAREIVIAHHGTISAQSKLGLGSTFSVRLPLSMQHQNKNN